MNFVRICERSYFVQIVWQCPHFDQTVCFAFSQNLQHCIGILCLALFSYVNTPDTLLKSMEIVRFEGMKRNSLHRGEGGVGGI